MFKNTCSNILFNSLNQKQLKFLKGECIANYGISIQQVLEKTLESPLDCKEIQPVHSEGDQPWDFFGRNDAKPETPVLWPPHVKS